jgi:hypothetical protein
VGVVGWGPTPQSPIPNPQSPVTNDSLYNYLVIYYIIKFKTKIFKKTDLI